MENDRKSGFVLRPDVRVAVKREAMKESDVEKEKIYSKRTSTRGSCG